MIKNRFLSIISIITLLLICFPSNLIVKSHPSNSASNTQAILNDSSLFTINSPYIEIRSIYQLFDGSSPMSDGDQDGQIDAGETIEFRLELVNIGDQDATNVYANLTTMNSTANIILSSNYITQFNRDNALYKNYVVQFDSKLNVSESIDFILNITANEGSWTDSFSVTIDGISNPFFDRYYISSENNCDLIADNDGVVDPGESISIDIQLRNNGDSYLFGNYAILDCNDTHITTFNSNNSFGTFEKTQSIGTFGFNVSGACPIYHMIVFNLTLVDIFENSWNFTIELIISGTPEYVISDIIFDEVIGDYDSVIEPGEEWAIQSIILHNIGNATSYGISTCLYSYNNNVDFYMLEREFPAGRILPNEYKKLMPFSDNYWRFKIGKELTDGDTLDFYFLINSSNFQTRCLNASISVSGYIEYQLPLFQIQIKDCIDPFNPCTRIYAGEIYEIILNIKNTGTTEDRDIEVTIYSDCDYFTENGSKDFIDYIIQNKEQITLKGWVFRVPNNARRGDVIVFTIIIESGTLEWVFQRSITVDASSLFITSPDGIALITSSSLATIVVVVLIVQIRRKRKRLAE